MGRFMHTTILTFLAALSVNARPSQLQSYGLPQTGGNNIVVSSPTGSPTYQGSGGSAVLGTSYGQPCTGKEVHNALGECVLPEISRNIFVYAAPNIKTYPGPAPKIPKPEVHYNLVFVKTADLAHQNQPIIVPPPQQKTLVYVLSKKQQQGGQNVIYAPHNPAASPEVFYVNYGQGDNPQLPGGVDLQTALSSAFTQGQSYNGQNQGNNFVGTGQNQGNNYVGNVINDPISGGIINGGVVDGGIINPGFDSGFGSGISISQQQVDNSFGQGGFIQQTGDNVNIQDPTAIQGGFGGGVSLGQTQVDNGFGQGGFDLGGFGQGGFTQQTGGNVNIQRPTASQGGLIDSGFGGGVSLGQTQVDIGFGPGGLVPHSPTQSTTGVQTPSTSLGYQYQTPSIPLTPTQSYVNPSPSGPPPPPPPPPSRPGQIYLTPN